MTWCGTTELLALGLHSIGKNVLISTRAQFYRPERIDVGSNSRIDDFVTLTAGPNGNIEIGEYVHIAAYCMIEAPDSVTFSDFSGLAARVTLYGGTDNYSGESLTNPCVPIKYRQIHQAAIFLGKHAVVGTNSVILPGAYLAEGCAVGAMSLVRGRMEPFTVYAGVPAKRLIVRSHKLLELEAALRESTRVVTHNDK